MRNLADVSYPLRHVLRRVLAYLQNTIIDDFPWFLSGTKTLEILEAKRSKGTLSAKHVATELLTFAIICTFFVVLFILSFKSYKEDEEQEGEESRSDQREESVNNETIYDLPRGTTHTSVLNSDESKENLQHRHDRGDSPAFARLEGQMFPNRIPNMIVHDFTGTVGPTISSAREPLMTCCYQPQDQLQFQYHQQRSRPRPRGYGSGPRGRQSQRQRAGHQNCKNLEWYVRRTRSGQIYGMYPF